jgi:hypothetical protein
MKSMKPNFHLRFVFLSLIFMEMERRSKAPSHFIMIVLFPARKALNRWRITFPCRDRLLTREDRYTNEWWAVLKNFSCYSWLYLSIWAMFYISITTFLYRLRRPGYEKNCTFKEKEREILSASYPFTLSCCRRWDPFGRWCVRVSLEILIEKFSFIPN